MLVKSIISVPKFCPDVFLAVDGDERQQRFHNFGLVTRLNMKSMFHT